MDLGGREDLVGEAHEGSVSGREKARHDADAGIRERGLDGGAGATAPDPDGLGGQRGRRATRRRGSGEPGRCSRPRRDRRAGPCAADGSRGRPLWRRATSRSSRAGGERARRDRRGTSAPRGRLRIPSDPGARSEGRRGRSPRHSERSDARSQFLVSVASVEMAFFFRIEPPRSVTRCALWTRRSHRPGHPANEGVGYEQCDEHPVEDAEVSHHPHHGLLLGCSPHGRCEPARRCGQTSCARRLR